MSNAYLALSSDRPQNLDELAEAVTEFLPFEPEAQHQQVGDDEQSGLWSWAVLPEASRGGFFSHCDTSCVTYNGWVAETTNYQSDRSIADWAANRLETLGPEDFARQVAGDWSLLRLSEGGVIDGICDFLGGQHLYYGQRNGLVAISNRAMLVAAALHKGTLPSIRPLFMSWLLTAAAAPVGNTTAFPHVKLLLSDQRLRAHGGQLRISQIPPQPRRKPNWSDAFEHYRDRSAQITRLSDLEVGLALTGGKDTRLVLGGLVACDGLESVDYAFLHATPEHPDVPVGRRLANHYGLDFKLFEPRTAGDDIFKALARHNFQTEFAVNAWDLKGCDHRRREATIHGTYGEIYRGHAEPLFALGWPLVRRKYLRRSYIDIADILTEPAIQHCRKGLAMWLDEQRRNQEGLLHLHDTFHRHVRMQRWMGQLQLHSSCATLAMAPIPSASLLARYRGLSWRNRQNERIHYELMRRCDPWLVEQPFLNDRWSILLPRAFRRAAPPTKGASHRESRQMTIWKKHGPTIADFLRDPTSSAFFDIVDADRLNALLNRVGETPDFVTLRAILAAGAIRQALDEPLQVHQITLESR